jgi:hypothetical protein
MKSTGMVVYDFDETIASIHIFHTTHGASDASEYDDQFFVDAIGGKERIAQLQGHFGRLKLSGIDLLIISHGWAAVIRESLERVWLGDFFGKDSIFGNDSELMVENRSKKGLVIREQMRLRHQSFDKVIFVDDDRGNVDFCENEGICQTLHIDHERGMTEDDMGVIEGIFC